MQQIQYRNIVLTLFIALVLGACSSVEDEITDSLNELAKTKSSKIDLSKYEDADESMALTDLPSSTLIYFDEEFVVIADDENYNGFGAGVFIFDGKHIDNNQAMQEPEACLLVGKTKARPSISKSKWIKLGTVEKVSQRDRNSSFDGIQINLLNSAYGNILLKDETAGSVTDGCFANTVRILTPIK